MLHSMNPARCQFIRDSLVNHFRLDDASPEPLFGLRVLDVGCGGGLLAESLARMGAAVTAVDAAEENVKAARAHAASDPLVQERVSYRAATAEQLVDEAEEFDAVTCLEVVEHVQGQEEFCSNLGKLTKFGGTLIMSTMNRTPLSYAVAIVGAEYVVNAVPKGTHHWERFVTPTELTMMLDNTGLELSYIAGMTYNPLTGKWKLGRDVRVNYISAYVKEIQREPAGFSGTDMNSNGLNLSPAYALHQP